MPRPSDKKSPLAWMLRLYVAGETPRSANAIRVLRDLCLAHLPGRHDIEVIDVGARPAIAARDNIVALPCLVKLEPEPVRRLVGNLANREHLLAALGIGV